MARTELTVANSGIAGFQPTETALQVDGHYCKLSKDLFIKIINGATGFTLTLATPAVASGGLAIAEYTLAIGSGETWIIGFKDIDIALFNQGDGTINIDYSDSTDGTITTWR